MLCWGLVQQARYEHMSDEYKNQYIFYVPPSSLLVKVRDTTVFPSEPNKRGEVKGINTALSNTYHITKLRKLSYHSISHNSLLIYPHFGIESFHIRLGINWYDCQSSLLRSAEQGKRFFSVPRLRIWSRETNSVVPSRVSPLIPHIYLHVIQAEYNMVLTHGLHLRAGPAFCDGVHIYRQMSSGQSRVYRATQLRTDGVYRKESTASRPVEVLKVARVTGCCIFSKPPGGNFCAPFFSSTSL